MKAKKTNKRSKPSAETTFVRELLRNKRAIAVPARGLPGCYKVKYPR